MPRFFLCFMWWISSIDLTGQPFLHQPVQGNYGEDFIIVHYVDWGASSAVFDHQCHTKTYNGHEGTDFVIRSFRKMDEGISVLAAADGLVSYVVDTMFDRWKVADPGRGLGNTVALRHTNGYFTYYGHLAKNSALVKTGDSVKAGMPIAKVGSSGNSSDPHLHFELYWDSLFVVDPFKGQCGNSQSLWLKELPYDTAFHVWTSGLCNFIPYLDTLREEPITVDTFYQNDEAISYWSIMYGLRGSDSLLLVWFDPDGLEWFRYSYKPIRDHWYFYFWSYILVPPMQKTGRWSTKLFHNGLLKDELLFYVSSKMSSANEDHKSGFEVYPNPCNDVLVINFTGAPIARYFKLYDQLGSLIMKGVLNNPTTRLDLDSLLPGLYTVIVEESKPHRLTILKL